MSLLSAVGGLGRGWVTLLTPRLASRTGSGDSSGAREVQVAEGGAAREPPPDVTYETLQAVDQGKENPKQVQATRPHPRRRMTRGRVGEAGAGVSWAARPCEVSGKHSALRTTSRGLRGPRNRG